MKKVTDSTVRIVQQMTHQDANLAGNVHGGTIMKLVDNTAGIAASRHASTNVVTASLDRIDFHSPVFIGDLLRITCSVNYVGTKSMEIGARVEAENFVTGEIRHTASAYLTFVSLDENFKPKEVPPIEFNTKDEKRRNGEAKDRRNLRLYGLELEKKKHEARKDCD